MEKIIDLHIHTTCSDGALTPFEVIDEAKKNGLYAIAIADHDTIEAYTDEVLEYAKKNDIKLIKAVEISTKIDKCGIHVLGYDIDITNKEFRDKLMLLRNARHDYLYAVSDKLMELGYKVNVNELDKIDAVTKAHIALDVISNIDNQELLINNFNHIPSKGEFIETIMNEGCPAYAKKNTVTPKEAADLIRSANGKVVLAHPVAYTYEDNLSEDDIKKIVCDMHADGIEAYYIYIDRNDNKHNDIEKWKNFALNNNLFVTIGSDFHNKDGLHPGIGLIGEKIDIDDNIVNKIIKDINK